MQRETEIAKPKPSISKRRERNPRNPSRSACIWFEESGSSYLLEIARGDAREVEGARRREEEEAGDEEEGGDAIDISHLELDLERARAPQR